MAVASSSVYLGGGSSLDPEMAIFDGCIQDEAADGTMFACSGFYEYPMLPGRDSDTKRLAG